MDFDFTTYAWCVSGIVISVLLPVGWAAVREFFPTPGGTTKGFSLGGAGAVIWTFIRPYALLGVVSAATAVLLVAFLGGEVVDWRAALLAGYAWDSTLQKLAK